MHGHVCGPQWPVAVRPSEQRDTRTVSQRQTLKESKYKDYTHGAEISTTQLCRRIDSVSEFSTPPASLTGIKPYKAVCGNVQPPTKRFDEGRPSLTCHYPTYHATLCVTQLFATGGASPDGSASPTRPRGALQQSTLSQLFRFPGCVEKSSTNLPSLSCSCTAPSSRANHRPYDATPTTVGRPTL